MHVELILLIVEHIKIKNTLLFLIYCRDGQVKEHKACVKTD